MSMLMQIIQFLNTTGMPPSRFGKEVAGDPMLVFDIRNGREPRPDLRRRINGFIADHHHYRHPSREYRRGR